MLGKAGPWTDSIVDDIAEPGDPQENVSQREIEEMAAKMRVQMQRIATEHRDLRARRKLAKDQAKLQPSTVAALVLSVCLASCDCLMWERKIWSHVTMSNLGSSTISFVMASMMLAANLVGYCCPTVMRGMMIGVIAVAALCFHKVPQAATDMLPMYMSAAAEVWRPFLMGALFHNALLLWPEGDDSEGRVRRMDTAVQYEALHLQGLVIGVSISLSADLLAGLVQPFMDDTQACRCCAMFCACGTLACFAIYMLQSQVAAVPSHQPRTPPVADRWWHRQAPMWWGCGAGAYAALAEAQLVFTLQQHSTQGTQRLWLRSTTQYSGAAVVIIAVTAEKASHIDLRYSYFTPAAIATLSALLACPCWADAGILTALVDPSVEPLVIASVFAVAARTFGFWLPVLLGRAAEMQVSLYLRRCRITSL